MPIEHTSYDDGLILGSLVPRSASEVFCTVPTAGELRGVDCDDAGLDTIDTSDEFDALFL